MKKLLVIILLCLLGSEGYSQMFGWGLTAGPNFAFVSGKGFSGDALQGSEALTGIHGGLIFQFKPRRFFTLYTGAEFVTKGANLNSSKNKFVFGSSNNKLRLNYLEVPLFVKLNLDPYSDIRPNIFAGPTFGFLLSGRDNYLLPQSAKEVVHTLYDTEINYRPFDPGFAFGAGLDLDMSDWLIFTMGAQYTLGFRNVLVNESIFVSDLAEMKNRNFRLNFGVIFLIPTYTVNTKIKKDLGFKKFKKYVN